MSRPNCPECGDRLDKDPLDHLIADCWVVVKRKRQENLPPPLPEQIVTLDAVLYRDDGQAAVNAPPSVRFGADYVTAA